MPGAYLKMMESNAKVFAFVCGSVLEEVIVPDFVAIYPL